MTVTVYDQTRDEAWGKSLRKLIDEWNAGTSGIDLVLRPDPANADCETRRGPFTVVVCVRENSAPHHVGEAYLYQQGESDHIAFVAIWMDPRPNPNRDHLACHELGHALGLGHRGANENSCMTDGPTKRPTHPDRKDFATVNSHYSHSH